MVLVIVNEMLPDFLGFIRYVPFPIFTSLLTKNRRKNTKDMEKKRYHSYYSFFSDFVIKTHLFTTETGENYHENNVSN